MSVCTRYRDLVNLHDYVLCQGIFANDLVAILNKCREPYVHPEGLQRNNDKNLVCVHLARCSVAV